MQLLLVVDTVKQVPSVYSAPSNTLLRLPLSQGSPMPSGTHFRLACRILFAFSALISYEPVAFGHVVGRIDRIQFVFENVWVTLLCALSGRSTV